MVERALGKMADGTTTRFVADLRESLIEGERRRQAEAERRDAEEHRRLAEAARKAEDEHDADGLVLLMKTVKGESDRFSVTITGTVVNRRERTLKYAQIKFNVYDESGARVGTALANITGLEAGGRWKFKAVALVDNGRSYKFSELSTEPRPTVKPPTN